MEIQLSEQRCGSKNQFDLSQISRFTQNINITLHKLTETSSLRSVCSPHITHLKCLKRSRKLICVVGIISGKRHSQIVAKSGVNQITFFLCFRKFQFLPTFQDLENKFLILSALFTGKIFNMFHTWCLYR